MIEREDWAVLPYEVREALSKELVRQAVPKMLPEVITPPEPHIILADKADNIANAEAYLAYTMKWLYAAVAGMCMGIICTTAGSIIVEITGNWALCIMGMIMMIAFFVLGVTWVTNEEPAVQHAEIVKAKAEYARTQRRLPQ